MKRTLLPLLLAPLAACGNASNQPPREVTPLVIPSQASAIAVPISARLADLENLANRVVPAMLGKILSQNFARDYHELLDMAGAAIAEKRLGDFVLSAHIDRVQNNIVYPAGQGLFLPVAAKGTAALRYAPLRKNNVRCDNKKS